MNTRLILVITFFLTMTTTYSQVGELDPSFADNGIFEVDFNEDFQSGWDILVQPDGKIVTLLSLDTTTSATRYDTGVMRLLENGIPDSTFGHNGVFQLDNIIGSDLSYDIDIRADGSFLIAGSRTDSLSEASFNLLKLTPDGQVDSTFGTNGHVKHFMDTRYDRGRALVEAPDGHIYMAGTSEYNFGGRSRKVISKYTPAGQIDSTFGANGVFMWKNDTTYNDLYDVLITPDGGLYACGRENDGPGASNQLTVHKILTNGTGLDSTFADNGTYFAPIGGQGRQMALHPNGNLIIVGDNEIGVGIDFAILSLSLDGVPSQDFGSDGISNINVGITDYATTVLIQPDGKIIIGGYSGGFMNSAIAVTRIHENGDLDTEWGNDGSSILQTGDFWSFGRGCAIQTDGKLLVSGMSNNSVTRTDLVVLRFGNFIDVDMDGFGLDSDCNDDDINVNPDATEITYNGIDDDCDPLTLDDDLDQDGYDLIDDCDDMNASVNPLTAEIPYNGLDDDCDALTLDDDLDQDGFLLVDDCDDTNAGINPDATEIENNGIDEDCDGEDLVVGVHESVLAQRFMVYPNPGQNTVFIDFEDESLSIDFVEILDYTGKVATIINETDTNKVAVNMAGYPSGLWLFAIHTNEGIAVKRIIKTD